ncbi:MAG: superoxide dismutase [Fe] [Marinilabiliales bacterium]|nr:MAG: superoxide dismutase [Fe] [Marinilabiliales bacterium]
MKFELPALPFEKNALEPYISAETLDFHYGKHHQAYVNNLNNLLPGSAFENASSLEEIIMKADGGIFNNAAQVWNHTFYWESLGAKGTGPTGALADAINRDFGSFLNFRDEFTKASLTLFGSGWAWLSKDAEGKLHITQESNAGNPMTKGLTPILTCDVWEHAYYVDKRNARPSYVNDFWKIINWEAVSARY